MKITTRHQLIKEIAQRIYEDFCIMDMEDTTDANRDWKMAEGVVSFMLDQAIGEYNWIRQCRVEDFQKFDIFIRNYEDNATDKVTI